MDLAVILIGLGIILLACAWYYFYSSKHITDDNLVGDAIVRSSEDTTTVDENGDEHYRVAVSIANPKTQADLLRLAVASAQYHRGDASPQVLALNIIKVPVQTSLEQNLQFEYKQIEQQRELQEEGREMIAALAEEAGIPADGYDAKVLVSNNIGQTITEAVESFNTVFFGISEQSTFAKILYGSVAASVAQKDNINVVMIRGKQHKHWTLKAALAKRLSE